MQEVMGGFNEENNTRSLHNSSLVSGPCIPTWEYTGSLDRIKYCTSNWCICGFYAGDNITMKAIFRSGDPDPLSYSKNVSIENTIGQVSGVNIQGIKIKPQDTRALDLWYNPATKQWSIAYYLTGQRVVIDLGV